MAARPRTRKAKFFDEEDDDMVRNESHATALHNPKKGPLRSSIRTTGSERRRSTSNATGVTSGLLFEQGRRNMKRIGSDSTNNASGELGIKNATDNMSKASSEMTADLLDDLIGQDKSNVRRVQTFAFGMPMVGQGKRSVSSILLSGTTSTTSGECAEKTAEMFDEFYSKERGLNTVKTFAFGVHRQDSRATNVEKEMITMPVFRVTARSGEKQSNDTNKSGASNVLYRCASKWKEELPVALLYDSSCRDAIMVVTDLYN